MNKHGKDLSNVIYLNIPTGKVWEFNLVRENDKAFLQKGWPKFVQFYSLNDKHCLMFKYKGNSQFDVIVFDTSASEIEYPFDPEPCRENNPLQNRKTNNSSETAQSMQSVTFDKLIISYNRSYSAFGPEEKKRVRDYYSDHCKHPSFATNMYPSFVGSKFAMGIPKTFAHKFLHNEPCPGTFNLQTDTGKAWPVRSCASVGNYGKTTMKLQGAGWRKFVLGNNLKVGDICIFELIKKQEFKIHIIRAPYAKEKLENIPAIIEVESD
ncbi:B3 domain-containing transcription factor VRN1-like [Chenopodium quinoa]|uniref:TF-B3 domain-containing protein n=1 Tax=Chenopodium quinoa TaxID=63459 RepID=A0A803KW42_CHEQI|nr:B3 domain-containing transcription factor VRN1-like [Chenopodium quinoa]